MFIILAYQWFVLKSKKKIKTVLIGGNRNDPSHTIKEIVYLCTFSRSYCICLTIWNKIIRNFDRVLIFMAAVEKLYNVLYLITNVFFILHSKPKHIQ